MKKIFYLLGTEISLKKTPRFVRITIILLVLYWLYALSIILKEIVTGSFGANMGYPDTSRFFMHYLPQIFFVPWIILNIFRKIPIFRTVPGFGFMAIGLFTTYQYGSYLIANLAGKTMVEISSGTPIPIPPLWEVAILLPLFVLSFITGVMLLIGKKEKKWYML
jgi:hypothetical protein